MWVITIMGIYKIENLVNGKIYIGQSINIERRWQGHRKGIKSRVDKEKPLYRAMNKYGIENFSFEVLEECEEEELDEKEIYYIEKYHSYIEDGGYNLTRGGSGSRKFTQQERRERIDKIVSLWEEGKTIKEISKITSIDNKDIIVCLKANCDIYSHKESRARGHDPLKRSVDCYTLWGDYICSFPSVSDTAKYFQVRREVISRSCKNNGAKSSLGYRFTYGKEEKKNRVQWNY